MNNQQIIENLKAFGVEVLSIRANKISINWKDYLKVRGNLDAKNYLESIGMDVCVRNTKGY